MSKHKARIDWQRQGKNFDYASYNRNHTWNFENGIEVPASAATQFLGNDDRVDPEEAFVASISSCHMLTFLAICAKKKLIVNSYIDHATGYLSLNEHGRLAITHVTLSPDISWEGDAPAPELLRKLHHLSHQECFIANSVTTRVELADQ